MTLVRLLARPMLASMFVVGGVNAYKNADKMAPKAKPVFDRVVPAAKKAVPQAPLPSDTETLVKANAAAQVAGGLLLATGKAPRLSANVLALSLIPTTLSGHRYWEESDPAAKANQKVHFFKNVSMLGGLLLAGVDTEGRPGVAWRVKHGAKTARREAKRARKAAKRESKRAGASARSVF
ncbi:MAG: DoxX family protein [Actinomycetota bacterium]|nr:DoxX family protein [Actinomycetota bacterium]